MLIGGMEDSHARLIVPAADVAFFEFDDAYQVVANLRGLTPKDVRVVWNPGILTVSGEKDLHPSQDRDDPISLLGGAFSYNISVPDDADRSAVTGWFRDGLLMLNIERLEGCAV